MFHINNKVRAWLVVLLLFLFMAINFADKAVIGLSAVPIMHDLALSPEQFGLVGSSFFVLFSISAIGFGFLSNRIKTKWLLALLSLVWALIQFPLVGMVSFPMLIACRVLLGAGEGPAFPLALHACYKWFDNRKRNVPSAIVQQGVNAGLMVAGPALTLLIVRYDWHTAFLALGIIGLVWTVCWLLLGAEGTVDEHTPEQAQLDAGTVPYRALASDRTLIGNFLLTFVGYAVVALCFTWIPAYFRLGLGYSATEAGWLFSLIIAVQIPITLGLSWFSQWLLARGVSSRLSRGAIPSACIAVAGLAFFCTAIGIGAGWKVACVSAGSTLSQFIFVFGPLMIGEVTPPRQRGAWLSVNNSVGTLAGLIAPVLMGRFIGAMHSSAAGFEHGFVVMGGLLVVSGLAGLCLMNPEESARRLRALAIGHSNRARETDKLDARTGRGTAI